VRVDLANGSNRVSEQILIVHVEKSLGADRAGMANVHAMLDPFRPRLHDLAADLREV
jgi:hypothetical protein